jgi:hypothetical protein
MSQVWRGDLRGLGIMQREQLTSICCSSSAIANDDRKIALTFIYIDDNLST